MKYFKYNICQHETMYYRPYRQIKSHYSCSRQMNVNISHPNNVHVTGSNNFNIYYNTFRSTGAFMKPLNYYSQMPQWHQNIDKKIGFS